MTRLFIIGNGFDRAHKMKTEYSHFREFLKDKYDLKKQEEVPDIPDSNMLPDGSEKVDTIEAVRLVGWLLIWCRRIGKNWCCFEDALAFLDFDAVMNENTIFCDDTDNLFKEAENYEMYAYNLQHAIMELPKLFSEWIERIEIAKNPKPDIRKLFRKSDLFLNFNYTETIEKLYQIPSSQVCHIHGKRRCRDKLMVGHGHSKEREFHVHWAADEILQNINHMLMKDTKGAIKKHESFFELIEKSHITEIYSYGFSFSEVDMVYIRKICDMIDTSKLIWYQNDYNLDAKTKPERELKIVKAGFKGSFGKPFHIND